MTLELKEIHRGCQIIGLIAELIFILGKLHFFNGLLSKIHISSLRWLNSSALNVTQIYNKRVKTRQGPAM